MLMHIVTIDNAIPMPTPVLDESAQGYHVEQRLQVTVKAPDNDRQFMVEFRPDNDDTPGMEQLIAWMESGELVRVVCSGVTARPFVHQDGKTYRSRGSVKQINGQETTLDTMVIFAGQYIVPAAETFDVDEEVKKARGIYKKQQRDFRLQRNTEKVAKLEAEMPERVAKMRAQREAQQAKEAEAAPAEAPQNGRRR